MFVNTKSSKGIYNDPSERINYFFFLSSVVKDEDGMAHKDVFPLSFAFLEEETVLP